MIARSRLLLAGILAAVLVEGSPVASQQPLCMVTGGVTPLAGVGEASGVAVSRRTPGVLWSHNDSGRASLFAFDDAGNAKGRVELTGVTVEDWEDLAVGSCPEGSCLYIADIGDNNRSRRGITIYRVPEPRGDDRTTAPAQAWTITYPDRPHDAEALFATSNGQLFLVSKEDARTTALYRVPSGSGGRLEFVAQLPLERVTGGAVSPDGNWVALRTNTELLFYPASDLIAGKSVQPRRFDLKPLKERQGEGVAFGADGVIYLVGEGGGRGGTLVTIRCALR